MERTIPARDNALLGQYMLVITLEFAGLLALGVAVMNGDMWFWILGVVDIIAALVGDELMRIAARRTTEGLDTYTATFGAPPLPGSLYHFVRAVIARRRLQRSG